jgi:hypothetical protein
VKLSGIVATDHPPDTAAGHDLRGSLPDWEKIARYFWKEGEKGLTRERKAIICPSRNGLFEGFGQIEVAGGTQPMRRGRNGPEEMGSEKSKDAG